MKRISTLIILAILAGSAISKDISESDAILVARNFFFERISQYKHISAQEIRTEDIYTIEHNGAIVLYAVNIEGGGFVVVAASDNVMAVPGYSLDGRYTGIGLPPQFGDLLEQYGSQVSYAREQSLGLEEAQRLAWERLLSEDAAMLSPLKYEKDVEPMLTTQWDQGQYYNEMCPADPAGPGGHCYAGCVATALGQVVNYFRWPETGTGSYTYSCPPYGDLTADFANTTYEWDKMATSLNKSNPAVALLLHHLGIGCDMVYGPNGSGMYNHKAAFTLRTYFKYSPETQYVYRDSTSMDWDSLIISHLDRKIPLYYAGWSVPNINGHAFVCDGYQAGNYYHFNWGWSGSYDGYFYTNSLNPGGSNFNLAQELVINGFPDTNLYSYPVFCEGSKVLDGTDGTIDDGSGPLYNYQDGTDCSWLIAPEDSVKKITLQFLHFETETGDILNVYDGETTASPLLGSFSGNNVPGEISSTGDRMLITFSSDGNGSAPGWLLSYTSEIPVYCVGMQNMMEQTASLSDGSGPRDYHNNTTCMWMITPPDATEITLHFTTFDTEAEFDKVKVYDPATQELLAELSGNELPGPISSPSGKLFITFSTNYTNTAPGWEAWYETDLVGIEES
ncbi:MAG TPA: C10 family peptidase, partial [Bacteroidales bacterium]|nr:C10 family peptidase [Bacteroidales bacterium]